MQQRANSMRITLINKIEEARLSKNAWMRSSCGMDTVRYWEGKLEAYQYALDLLNWKEAGSID